MTSASTTPQTDREALIAAVQSAERCARAATAGQHVDMNMLGAEMRAALWAAGAEVAPAPAPSPMGGEFGEIEQIMRAAGLDAADRLRDVADGARRVFEHMAAALEGSAARQAEALAKFRSAILAIPCEMGMHGNNFPAGHRAALEAVARHRAALEAAARVVSIPGATIDASAERVDTVDVATPAPGSANAIDTVRAALREYYDALTARQHGGIAQNHAFNKIQQALGMTWDGHKAERQAIAAMKEGA